MQDVLLIGLGNMGSRVLAEFDTLLKDRMRLMGAQERENFRFWFLSFSLDTPFNYAVYSSAILEAVRDSHARRFNKDLLYIVAGSLGEKAVCEQVIDVGYMLELLQINGLLRKREAVCYLTFSDLLGFADDSGAAGGQDTIEEIYGYCKQLAAHSRERRYVPPYRNVDGINFPEINTPGPYDRNYLFVTPGSEEAVRTVTVNVFAGKIFYELFFFREAFAAADKEVHALRQEEKAENCFSAFSLVQVPRLEELQKHYLEYCFQELLLGINLLADVQALNLDYYKKVFLEAIEFTSAGCAFPCDRMVDLFVKKYIDRFTGVLAPYIPEADFTHYAAECDRRINRVLESIEPHFNSFLENEMQVLGSHIKQLATDLFRAEPLSGYFALYREFFRELAQYMRCWPASLQQRLSDTETFDIKACFEKVQVDINELNRHRMLNFVLFKPIKQAKVRELLETVPFDAWIRGKITKRLIRLLLDFFLDPEKNPDHPLLIVQRYLEQQDAFLAAIKEHAAVVRKKKDYIGSFLSFYYVVSWEKPANFRKLLAKLEERTFGLHNRQHVLDYARGFFPGWLKKQADIYDIFYSAAGYLESLETYTRVKGRHLFDVERDREHEENFAARMEQEVEARLENLTAKSFATVARNYLKHLSLVLAPAAEQKDPLILRAESMAQGENVVYKECDGEFTLGSLVFIREYLYMPLQDMIKSAMFEKYSRPGGTKEQEDSGHPPGREEELLARYLRAIIKQYFPPSLGKLLYRQAFNTEKETLSAEDVDALSRAVTPAEVLSVLGDNALKDVAREYNAIISADREKMMKMIERNIRLDLKKRLSRE